MNQGRMPFVEALESYKKEQFVPFHTPGHKIGHGAHEKLMQWMGPSLPYDLGVMYALDDLHEPEGVLKEAQELAAELYGADAAYFSINGTTALIEAMIMGTVGQGDTIIIPREAHRSVVSGLVLSGAKPVYLEGRFDKRWGVTLGTTVEEVRRSLEAHPEAKALLLVYPNYYGIGIAIQEIIEEAHSRGVIVLVDEAHGAHLPFSDALPIEAIEAGADLVAQSTHKLVGSLTQTSILLAQGNRINYRRITQVHQMLQSTSPNYIFLASLDMARHQLAMNGKELVGKAVTLSCMLREKLNEIKGIVVPCQNDFTAVPHFDMTKVLIDATGLGLRAVEFERRLRAHRIEVELIQAHHALVLITMGDTQESIDALVEAVQAVSDEVLQSFMFNSSQEFSGEHVLQQGLGDSLPVPDVAMTPREAFYSERETVNFTESIGRISGETISYYPPGIPFVCMGERLTESVVSYIEKKQAEGYVPNGAEDKTLQTVQVLVER